MHDNYPLQQDTYELYSNVEAYALHPRLHETALHDKPEGIIVEVAQSRTIQKRKAQTQ